MMGWRIKMNGEELVFLCTQRMDFPYKIGRPKVKRVLRRRLRRHNKIECLLNLKEAMYETW